jgi:hypothetical protein
MTEGHGTPLSDAAAFDALPEEVQDQIRADFATLRSNLPHGELRDDEAIGIGATSAGMLVLKTAAGAYQLMEDGTTLRARPGAEGLELVRFKDGRVIEEEVVRRPADGESRSD